MSSGSSGGFVVGTLVLGAIVLGSIVILANNSKGAPVVEKKPDEKMVQTSTNIGMYTSSKRGITNLYDLVVPGQEVEITRKTGQFNMPMWLAKLPDTNLPAFELYRLPPTLSGKSSTLV